MDQIAARALITGASSGIGAAYARRLAAEGVNLVLVARRRDRLEALAQELRAERVEVEILAADLANTSGLASVEARLKADPAIDMLVNNAGFGVYGSVAEADPAVMAEMINLNVTVPSRLAAAAASAMVTRGAGTIVNVSSGLAFLIQPVNAVYGGTKAYILNFTRAMHLDLGERGLRIQALCPGIVRTEFGDRSGTAYDRLPPHLVMTAEELVDASVKGLALGEVVCIPSLPDYADYEAFEAAQGKVAQGVSRDTPAARYR
jgi:uncharacterized protein